MMKKIGYAPEEAGAVEAVASTGGQIMPPIMGAGAFLMASFLRRRNLLKTIGLTLTIPELPYRHGLPAKIRPDGFRNM